MSPARKQTQIQDNLIRKLQQREKEYIETIEKLKSQVQVLQRHTCDVKKDEDKRVITDSVEVRDAKLQAKFFKDMAESRD